MTKIHKFATDEPANNNGLGAKTVIKTTKKRSPLRKILDHFPSGAVTPLPGDGSMFLVNDEIAEIHESQKHDNSKRVFEITSWNGRPLMVIERV